MSYARAGALDYAWQRFGEEGFLSEAASPIVLNVKGRLLKALAARAPGAQRVSLFAAAASAYESAAAIAPSSYSLINAATLYFLASDPERARSLAERTRSLVDAEPDEPETPYWRSATRAEALLLLNREAEARAAFAEAIALAPQAWEDHASTLRQFALILDAQGKDAAWLDAHRPPRSLHFGGHMSFDAGVSRREHLDDKIAALLDEEKVGFGYGALAAGADIIVAEALVGRGAELHAVLPGGAETFAAVSVDPFGTVWRQRFDALLGRAATVRAVRPLGAPPDPETIALADEIAMGAAAMNARRLESHALQLLVADADAGERDPAGASAGWRQRVVAAPREAAAAAAAGLPSAAHRRLALLTIRAEAGDALAAIAAGLQGEPPAVLGPYYTGREIVVGYAGPAEAAATAVKLATEAGAAVGGHYGVAQPVRDPFGGELRIGGDAAALAAGAAASAPPGSACVTADFAAALAASGEARVHSELIGELDARDGSEPVELYALKPRL
ncbi:MAG TPA: hypothetical protein VGB08_09895 [Allosphingosinicella sp.]